MINADMRSYDYFLYADADAYGQAQLSKETQGAIKMAINITSQSIQDSIAYQNAEFIGLTRSEITDKYVIQYGDIRLKVLYINPRGRFKQVYMARVD